MAFTIHGWQIPDSPIEPDDLMTEKPARCGGPNKCDVCDVDVTEWRKAAGLRLNGRVDEAMLRARMAVANYFNTHADPTDGVQINIDQVFLVSFTYVLGGWKGMVSTTVPDGMYYETTFNKEEGVIYLDAYKKLDQEIVLV